MSGHQLLRRAGAAAGTEPLEEEGAHPDAREGVWLVAYWGETSLSIQVVPGRPVVLGREGPADVVLPDPKLSREHARLSVDGVSCHVEDLGSRNGLWSAGRRVAEARLSAGDEVVVGTTVLRLRRAEPRSPLPAGEAYLSGPAMRGLLLDIERVASARIPVVLRGETGSGKEVVAGLLHRGSPRSQAPLLRVNCAAIPAQLVEGLLFGHERGAYTGAHQRQRGIFEEADGGTVFLDEIGELSPAAQASMLRVLETGSFTRVGSPHEVTVDVRIIAASHRSLEAMVEAGSFRADLYYRLNGVTLTIPPLRARRSDIEPIARQLLSRAAEANGRSVKGIAVAALEALERYAWPGNVRELKNTIDQMVVLAREDVLELRHVPATIRAAASDPDQAPVVRASTNPKETPAELEDDVVGQGGAGDDEDGELRARVSQYESKLIADALRSTGGNKTEAARLLGLPIRTLSRRIKQLKIGDDD